LRFKPYLSSLLAMMFVLTACVSDPGEPAEIAAETEPGTVEDAVAENDAPAVNRAAPAPSVAPQPVAQPQRVAPPAPVAAPAPVAPPIVISSGTAMEIMLIDPISTETNVAGDEFLAAVSRPISVNGATVVEEGVRVRGRIVDLQEPGRVNGRARIEIVLFELIGQNGRVPISTTAFVEEAEADLGRDATLGAAGAAAGAIIGGLAGGRTGAIVGGAAGGAGTVMATRGDQLEYPAESRMTFTLRESIEIPAGQTIS
jgi:hypothetical protein